MPFTIFLTGSNNQSWNYIRIMKFLTNSNKFYKSYTLHLLLCLFIKNNQIGWKCRENSRFLVSKLVNGKIYICCLDERQNSKNSREIIVSSEIHIIMHKDFGPNLQHQYIWQDHSLASENFQICGCNLWCWFLETLF